MINLNRTVQCLLSRNTAGGLKQPFQKRSSWWSHIKMGPSDPIFGLVELFEKDTNPNKLNVSYGAYRDDNGQPYVLPPVRTAEERVMAKNWDKEYLSITGIPAFNKLSTELIFGPDAQCISEKRHCTLQTIAGSGALCLGAVFLAKFWPGKKTIYLPDLTWPNHPVIFSQAGLAVNKYKYYDPKTNGFDYDGCLNDICRMPKESIILFHTCAHNPTGVDPTLEQWCEISNAVKERSILPFFDLAYAGFASGDFFNDIQSVRLFEKLGHNLCLAHSYSKTMGIYSERIGSFTVIGNNEEEIEKILSQLKIIVRGLYSNPVFGGYIVIEVLQDDKLRKAWLEDLKSMSDRIVAVRQKLRKNLIDLGSKRSWDHITDQAGFFCFTGIEPKKCDRLIKDFSVYLTRNGRISVAGLSSKNVDYLANAMHEVTK